MIVFKKDRELSLLDQLSPLLKPVQIVPAIFMKRIADHGRAQRKAYLRTSHAGLQLVHHFLGNDITLLNLYLVEQGRNR